MANALNTRPIKLDTAMTSGHQASVGAVAGNTIPVYVKFITWVGPVTANDTFTIIDPVSSTVLFTAKAATADLGRTLQFTVNKVWADYKLSQISSGTVLVHE